MLLNILQYILFKMRILSHFRNSGLDVIRMDNKKRTNGADMSGSGLYRILQMTVSVHQRRIQDLKKKKKNSKI